jgi:ubiquinone biosynthesis protein
MGALPDDTDLDQLVTDLDLDAPPKDPTQMSPEELTAEIRELTKKLLAYGARMPKELMLFVKNMVFSNSMQMTLAPDVDLFGEITYIATYFATRHGDRIAADVGVDPRSVEVDLSGMKASMGVGDGVQSITPRELAERRRLIQERMQRHQRERRRARR